MEDNDLIKYLLDRYEEAIMFNTIEFVNMYF